MYCAGLVRLFAYFKNIYQWEKLAIFVVYILNNVVAIAQGLIIILFNNHYSSQNL